MPGMIRRLRDDLAPVWATAWTNLALPLRESVHAVVDGSRLALPLREGVHAVVDGSRNDGMVVVYSDVWDRYWSDPAGRCQDAIIKPLERRLPGSPGAMDA